MRYFLVILIFVFSKSLISQTVDNNECYEIINKIINDYSYLENLEYNDTLRVGEELLNQLIEDIKNTNYIKLIIADKSFSNNRIKYFDKMFYYYQDSSFIDYIAVSDKDTTNILQFWFARISEKWYLTNICKINTFDRYFIQLDSSHKYMKDDRYFDTNLTNINKIINDEDFLKEFANKSKDFVDFTINKRFKIDRLVDYIEGIENKEYKIISEKRFSTINKDLMNHRVCIRFESGEELFLCFVYFQNNWLLENWDEYFNMYPFNPATKY